MFGSAYMCWEITNHGHAFLRREHAYRRRGSTPGLLVPCNSTRGNNQGVPSTLCADAALRLSPQYGQVTHGAPLLVHGLREPLIHLSSRVKRGPGDPGG